MAFAHGKDAEIFAGGTGYGLDLTAYVKRVSHSGSAATADVTTLNDDWTVLIAGNRDATMSLEGLFDPAAGKIHDLFKGLLGATIIAAYFPQGDTLGNVGFGTSGILTGSPSEAPSDGAVTENGEIASSSGFEYLVSLHALAAETATGNGTSHDNTASSANGGSGFLIITAKSGTSPTNTVKIQHSADNTTWVDLVTFTQATDVGAQHVAATGTVNRYLRESRTIGGTGSPSFTFFAGFARR